MAADLLPQLLGGLRPAHQDHIADDGLAGDLVFGPHHRGLGHGRVVHQRRLHLGGGDAVARHVHHIVHPAQQPEVAVVVHPGPVAREVAALVGGPVGLAVALGVAPDAPQHRRPGAGDGEVAAAAGLHGGAVGPHHLGEDPGQGAGGRARLGGGGAGQRGDHVAAGLGLPPGVHHRAALAADVAVVPHPRLGVDGLPHRAQHPQAGQVAGRGPLLAPPHEGADGGGGGVELGHAVALDDVPQPVLGPSGPVAVPERGPGSVGGALVHHRGAAVGQRAVDDVAVAGHPADVGCAPEDVGVGPEVEHVLVGEADLGEVAAGGVHDALGLGRGPRRVQQVQELLGVHGLGRAHRGRLVHQVAPPQIPALGHGRVGAAAVHHHHVLHGGGPGRQGQVDVGLERRRRPPPVAGVGGYDQPGFGVLAPVGDGIGREPAEDHRVGHPDAGAGQHGHRQLGDHRHVYGRPVALAQAQPQQRVGEPLHVGQQLSVGDGPGVAGLPLPVDGHLVAPARLHVAVQAVVGDVEGAADEPLGEGQVPFQGGVEVVVPVEELSGLAGPERLVVGGGLGVQRVVGGEGRGREVRRRGEGAVFALVDLNRPYRHGRLP